jgi:1-acyl-sn-glycerol-3-phosphate acyltransferase
MLEMFRTRVRVRHRLRLPRDRSFLLVVGSHRSFLDAPLLLHGLGKPVRFVCHPYLAQVPVVSDLVRQIGGFYMGAGGRGWAQLFTQAARFLRGGSHVAIFPEGAQLITQPTRPGQVGTFRRGFAHLALRAGIVGLPIVPVAIVSHRELSGPMAPLRLLSLFDASEPMFQREGWHPFVLYERVDLVIGEPRRIGADELARYRGGEAAAVTASLARELQRSTVALAAEGLAQPW